MEKQDIVKKWGHFMNSLKSTYPDIDIEDASLYMEYVKNKYPGYVPEIQVPHDPSYTKKDYFEIHKDIGKNSFQVVMFRIYLRYNLKNDEYFFEKWNNMFENFQFDENHPYDFFDKQIEKFEMLAEKYIRKQKLNQINEKI